MIDTRAIREAMRLSQEDFAELLGVQKRSRQCVGKRSAPAYADNSSENSGTGCKTRYGA